MKPVIDLMKSILDEGVRMEHQNSIRYSVFGRGLKFDLKERFPVMTTKHTYWKAAIAEMQWFIRGDHNTSTLEGTNIWKAWQDDTGDIGPMYGALWRNWQGHDQLLAMIIDIRRHINVGKTTTRFAMTAYDPTLSPDRDTSPQENIANGYGALAPCHWFMNVFLTYPKGVPTISIRFDMRSSDVPVGLPFNIIGYAYLTHVIAQACAAEVGDLYVTIGDAHIYENQLEMAEKQCAIEPVEQPTKLILPDNMVPLRYTMKDVDITGYTPGPKLKYEVTT